MTLLKIHEITKSDLGSEKIKICRDIFMNYFLDLYKDKTSENLQIKSDTAAYLEKIFNSTEQALKNQENLHAILAYINSKPVGFSTFNLLENPEQVLIRTLPVNLEYKNIELEIRNKYIDFVRQKFPNIKQVIIMVRYANTHHQELCLKSGFIEDKLVFDKSNYIKNNYDSTCYLGYVRSF